MAKSGSIVITETKQYTSTKETRINIVGSITTSGDSYRGESNSGTYNIYQGGSLLTSGSFAKSAPANSTTELFNINHDIQHYSDGSSGTIKVEYDYSSGWCTASASKTLNPFCTITYNANGGTGAPTSHTYAYATSGVTNLSPVEPVREGYQFLGWSLDSNATEPKYYSGQAWNLSNKGNYTLYAVWRYANVGYVKENGVYRKCNTYIKVDGIWTPGVVYCKTDGVWRQGII